MFAKIFQANSSVFRLASRQRYNNVPANAFSSSKIDLSQYDPSQTKAFNEESLLLVDRNDKVVGNVSKIEGHLNSYNRAGGYAHRAFSVFLFNQNNELLLHQRSEKKITFPMLWTNSCCSHPLNTPEEMVEENYLGAKRAIRRRVEFELGHDLKEMNDAHFMGKIYYSAESDQTWGEHELDYCFFIKRDFKPEDFKFSNDEIQEIKWVGKNDIMKFLAERQQQKNETITPWFGALMHYSLFKWWDVLISGDIKNYKASTEIPDLNTYQKPLFVSAAGGLKPNVDLGNAL